MMKDIKIEKHNKVIKQLEMRNLNTEIILQTSFYSTLVLKPFTNC